MINSLLPVLIIGGFIALYLFYLYNDLMTAKVRMKEAWSQIDVQLKRRADLIPNLIETVKGYAKHEKTVFENVTKARAQLLSATGPLEKAAADNQLVGALKSLFAVAENYPKLAANENFLQLQKELSDTEDKVSYARQFYNTQVSLFNTKIVTFPSMILAKQMGLSEEEFFKTDEDDSKIPKVSFHS
ncbi:LemA family protein [Candidatus Gottesmanbacteria bacterium]|nr:LemA family protein [Candidatus Gottesmanbacteria bacterium]